MTNDATTIAYTSALIITLIWAWLGRMCGGAPPKLPYGLDQLLYALPYLVISIPAWLVFAAGLKVGSRTRVASGSWSLPLLLLPYTAAVAGKRTGHGGGIDAGTSTKVRDDEALEFIIKPLHGRISEYWYDILLLSVTGIAVTLLAGVSVAVFCDPVAGILLALSGLSKGPAYMIGWAIYPSGSGRGIPHLNEATAIGELLTAFFAIGSLCIITIEFDLLKIIWELIHAM